MKIIKIARPFLLIIMILICFTSTVARREVMAIEGAGCSCKPSINNLESAATVLSAVVKEIRYDTSIHRYEIRLAASHMWRGETTITRVVTWGSCPYLFEKGREYIFFLFDETMISSCSSIYPTDKAPPHVWEALDKVKLQSNNI